jgi:regulator of protease activity HflC (stomatin/prohibitin superfamily)
MPIAVVRSYEQGVRFSCGRDVRLLDTGVYVNVPLLWTVETRSCCEEAITSSPHTVVTKDGRSLLVAVTVRYAISDLRKWYTQVQDFDATLVNVITTEACRVLRQSDFATAIGSTDTIVANLGDWLTEECEPWGVDIIAVGFHTFSPTRCFSVSGGSK